MMTGINRGAGVQDAVTTLHDGAIYGVLHMLEWNLARDAGLGRYDIEDIVSGIASSYDRHDSYDSAQAVPLIRDYIKHPKKYDEIRLGTRDRPRTGFGTVYASRLLSQMGRHAEALDLVEGDLAGRPGSAQA
ncbi:MAG: hypothetical protein MPL62_13395 [Alphaproteobacteria bacterium]|nr:hypothetical protein [Alphaproteobacteria bacterium]